MQAHDGMGVRVHLQMRHPFFSLLYGADHDAGHEILLQEGVDHEDRDHGDHDLRGIEGQARHFHVLLELFRRHARHLLGVQIHDQGLNVGLQRQLFGRVNVDFSVEEGVPVVDNGEQRDGGQSGARERQIDTEQDGPGVAPSTNAASSSAPGTFLKKFIRRITLNTGTAPGRISAQIESISRPASRRGRWERGRR